MKDAALLVMPLLLVWVLLSWATAPSAVMAERALRLDAERRVVALSTRVALLVPTPTLGIKCPAWPRC